MGNVDVDIFDFGSVRAYLERIAATEKPAVLVQKATELITYMMATRDAMAALVAEQDAEEEEKPDDET